MKCDYFILDQITYLITLWDCANCKTYVALGENTRMTNYEYT
jgi:hypothetical protein